MFHKLFAVFVSIVLSTQCLAKTATIQNISDTQSTQCIAEAVYHEARGEPIQGQAAVMQVILNRMKQPEMFGPDACSVVYQRGQFSWTKSEPFQDKRHQNNPVFEKIQTQVSEWSKQYRNGVDFSPKDIHNATFFSRGRPKAHNLKWVGKIGHHQFYTT